MTFKNKLSHEHRILNPTLFIFMGILRKIEQNYYLNKMKCILHTAYRHGFLEHFSALVHQQPNTSLFVDRCCICAYIYIFTSIFSIPFYTLYFFCILTELYSQSRKMLYLSVQLKIRWLTYAMLLLSLLDSSVDFLLFLLL